MSKYDCAIHEMHTLIMQGKLKRKFHIEEGLENCPEYMNMLFTGSNTGKL